MWFFEKTKGWTWKDEDISESHATNSFTVVGISSEIQEGDEANESSNFASSSISQIQTSPGGSVNQLEEDNGYRFEVSSNISEPTKFRMISDIYIDTKEVELDEALLFMGVDESLTYDQVVKEKSWRVAIQSKIESIEKNNTWQLTEITPGHKGIGLKWVYKLKRDTNGKVVKYKARLVAKGYVQKHGINFEEVFTLVI